MAKVFIVLLEQQNFAKSDPTDVCLWEAIQNIQSLLSYLSLWISFQTTPSHLNCVVDTRAHTEGTFNQIAFG